MFPALQIWSFVEFIGFVNLYILYIFKIKYFGGFVLLFNQIKEFEDIILALIPCNGLFFFFFKSYYRYIDRI